MLGKILGGRYHIASHLGGGGFGTTFVAEDRHLPGTPRCVVKQLKPATAGSPLLWETARRLFNREAEVLYKLGNHEQIPRLFAHFEEEQEFYLVQEYIQGHELRQELRAGEKLSEAQVIAILQEILEILAFVHRQNVIHRDIKPSNILRRWRDNKLVLIDFGAVKQISTQALSSSGQTSLSIAIGSPGYMPNEQLAGKPRFSSDIFAVGMIGIQALTGVNPKDLPEDPITCEIVWRDLVQVSSELADVVDKMVRYDFRQRYQSAVEVLEALNSVSSIPFTPSTAIPVTPENPNLSSATTVPNIAGELSSEEKADSPQRPQSSVRNRIAIVEGNITLQQVDAIVNPTDRLFSGGGGTDRAIHRAAGPGLREECSRLSGCVTGEAKITGGYNLPARWVIHTVGPIWHGGNSGEEEKLTQCYRNCLALAEQYSIRTIAFPSISTGAYGFPIDRAARIAVPEVKLFLGKNTSVEKVIFVCFGQRADIGRMAYNCYVTAVKEILE
ncbi:macro domain-containing protein [Kamptonema formosum]|uniref:macro domain-containing protein n=1 Tax=Kamptonema formosum TaxID=331992 RepID=UPI000345E7BA